MRRMFMLCMLVAAPAFGQLDVRHMYITNDVSWARSAVAPMRWYQGESVKIDLWAVRGSTPLNLTGADTVRFEVFSRTNQTVAFMMETGTIVTATNGYVTFDVTPGRANLPTNTYYGYVKAYQTVGTEQRYVGTLYNGNVQVYWGPSATNYAYAGPYGVATGIVPNVTLTEGSSNAVTVTGDTINLFIKNDYASATDHAGLANLNWVDSGHTGTPTRVATFGEGNTAGLSALQDGVEYHEGNIRVTAAVRDGAAAGAVALPASWTNATLARLGRDVRSSGAMSVGQHGAAFGIETTAGDYGAAFGASSTAGEYSAAFGANSTAGEYSAAFGANTAAGDYSFSAGRLSKAADGSFVYSDSTDADFNRLAHTNAFSVRASGGTYFDTPTFAVTGILSAASISIPNAVTTVLTNKFAGYTNELYFLNGMLTNSVIIGTP